MSRSSTPLSDRDQLLFLGRECHHAHCHLHDFLPFACPACKLDFCQEHFLPSHHTCAAPLPASMVDRIAPQCPMCDQIVSYPPGGRMDPNEAVEHHILSGTCVGMEGGEARKKAMLRLRKEKGEVCFRRGCSKTLVVPMKCDACKRSFCPPHRHAASHSCAPTPAASGTSTPAGGATRPGAKAAMSRLLSSSSGATTTTTTTTKSTTTTSAAVKPAVAPAAAKVHAAAAAAPAQIEARAAAAAAAMKRAGQDVKVPFVKTKTEKRANDELQSTLKSLKARHDKGLLSPAEQVRYAELVGKQESGRRKKSGSGSSKDKDCIIA